MARADFIASLIAHGMDSAAAESAIADIETAARASALAGAPALPSTDELLAIGVGLTAEEIGARLAKHRAL